jgi:hypothetical protein
MSNFTIDFFELSFLAEACIPPRPIARTYFWQNLTRTYWNQMTENERARLFEWMQRNSYYEDSLKNEEETKIFHARFDPDNQYEVTTKYKRKKEKKRAFKMGDRFYVGYNTFIADEYIIGATKLDLLTKING